MEFLVTVSLVKNWLPWCLLNKQKKVLGELSVFQKQTVIKLIEKRDKDKQLIKKWRPVSLLNKDTKLVSKVLAERLKTTLPSLISSNRTAYLNGRFFSEAVPLIFDMFEVSDFLKLNGSLQTLGTEKAL